MKLVWSINNQRDITLDLELAFGNPGTSFHLVGFI